eukprot:PhF_6_TR29217/c0_g1_i1/m.42750
MSNRVSSHPHRSEILKLYRNLLRNADKYPLRSRRMVVSSEIKEAFRKTVPIKDVPYQLVLGWQRNETIKQYAQNMHWFHSRDEVTPDMMEYSKQRDLERSAEVARCNMVGDARKKNEDVTKFKSGLFHYHPDYYNKVEMIPLKHSQDIWKARGSHGSDLGGPRQRFFIKRYKALFPQGW